MLIGYEKKKKIYDKECIFFDRNETCQNRVLYILQEISGNGSADQTFKDVIEDITAIHFGIDNLKKRTNKDKYPSIDEMKAFVIVRNPLRKECAHAWSQPVYPSVPSTKRGLIECCILNKHKTINKRMFPVPPVMGRPF